jgi:hypothetical protein
MAMTKKEMAPSIESARKMGKKDVPGQFWKMLELIAMDRSRLAIKTTTSTELWKMTMTKAISLVCQKERSTSSLW